MDNFSAINGIFLSSTNKAPAHDAMKAPRDDRIADRSPNPPNRLGNDAIFRAKASSLKVSTANILQKQSQIALSWANEYTRVPFPF